MYQVVTDGLPTEFPVLRSVDYFMGNLPQQLSSLVGRGERGQRDRRARSGKCDAVRRRPDQALSKRLADRRPPGPADFVVPDNLRP